MPVGGGDHPHGVMGTVESKRATKWENIGTSGHLKSKKKKFLTLNKRENYIMVIIRLMAVPTPN